MVLRKQAEPGHSWLFWFGDHKITEVRNKKKNVFFAARGDNNISKFNTLFNHPKLKEKVFVSSKE